jgi:hypothetical protein
MSFAIEILITTVITLSIGLPLVNTFDKWKKEMEKELSETNEREREQA